MKQKKIKSAEKKKRKEIRSSVEENLIKAISESISRLGFDTKKLKKDIEKSAGSIARRVAEKAKISEKELQAIANKSAESKGANSINQPQNTINQPVDEQSVIAENNASESSTLSAASGTEPGKREVREGSRNVNIDPIVLAEQTARAKAAAGEPDLDEQLGVS